MVGKPEPSDEVVQGFLGHGQRIRVAPAFRAASRRSNSSRLVAAWLESLAEYPGDINVWLKVLRRCRSL